MMVEEPVFNPISKQAKMRERAWGSLDEIIKPIDFIVDEQSPNNLDLSVKKINTHLDTVFKSPSYPEPITDVIMDKTIEYARQKVGNRGRPLIVDPRTV